MLNDNNERRQFKDMQVERKEMNRVHDFKIGKKK